MNCSTICKGEQPHFSEGQTQAGNTRTPRNCFIYDLNDQIDILSKRVATRIGRTPTDAKRECSNCRFHLCGYVVTKINCDTKRGLVGRNPNDSQTTCSVMSFRLTLSGLKWASWPRWLCRSRSPKVDAKKHTKQTWHVIQLPLPSAIMRSFITRSSLRCCAAVMSQS